MNSVITSSFLTVAMRWTDRLIGFISTLILARLLVPDDFGIIAMASLVIGLTEVLLDLGVNVALIQNKAPSQDHYNTAWTLRLLQSLAATVIVVCAAPWAADYFKEPRIAIVIQVLVFALVLGALENMGIVTFQKEMQFGRDFKFLFLKRIVGFCVTMAFAWWLRSYWALVIGTLVGRTFGIWLSYAMHDMRPCLSLVKWREIFTISQWLLVRNISLFLDNKLHLFAVGRAEAAEIMGAYTLADEIATMPTSELLAPVNRVLFPAFVQVKDDALELKRVFLLAQGIQTLICIPAGIGLALVAGEAVPLLLGDKWVAAIPFVRIIALAAIISAISSSGIYLLLTLGHVRTIVLHSWFQVLLFAISAFVLWPHGGAMEIAWLRLAVALIGIGVFLVLLLRKMEGLRGAEIAAVVYRPLLAAAIMVGGVLGFTQASSLVGITLLGAKMAVGVVSYSLAIVAIWFVAGRPYGAESYILVKYQEYRARKA